MEQPGIATKITQVMPGDEVVFNWSMSGGFDDVDLYINYLSAGVDSSTGTQASISLGDTIFLHENCDWCSRAKTYTWYVPNCVLSNSIIDVKLFKHKKNWFASGYSYSELISTRLQNGSNVPQISFAPSKVYALCTSDDVTLSIASENPDPTVWEGVWHTYNHTFNRWTPIHTGDTYYVDYSQPGAGGDGGYIYKVIYKRKDGGCAFSMHGFVAVFNVPNLPTLPQKTEVFCDQLGGLVQKCTAPNTYAVLSADEAAAMQRLNQAINATVLPG